jgi:LacI family transcriptional regulator
MTTAKSRQRNSDPQRITLKQIADAVGMHVMTVSRALHGLPGRTSEETRARIRATAERLGYRPNLMAQALQTGYSHNIGVIIRPRSEFGSELLSGVHDGLIEHGWLPILHYQTSGMGGMADPKVELELIHRLLDRRVDGLIIFPSDAQVADAHFTEIWKRNVPLVSVDHFMADTRADFAGTDDRLGGRLAANHLVSLGHRQLGLIRGNPCFSAYLDRAAGFVEGTEGCQVETVDLGREIRDEVAKAVTALLQRPIRPSAIFCPNDHVAAVVIEICTERSLKVPRDISVVGYADLSFVRHLDPPLTTIAQNPHAVGCAAADLIIRRCRGEEGPPRQVRHPPMLVVRASTCPAQST